MALSREIKGIPIAVTGLLAASLLIFQSYVSIPSSTLDYFQKLSLYFFAVAIPSLSVYVIIMAMHISHTLNQRYFIIATIINMIGILSALSGVILTFFHFSRDIGYLFASVCVVLFITNTFFIKHLNR